MKDNRIKNEFAAMEVPDMKTGILAAIRQKKAVSHRRRMRPAAIAVIAAMLALFGITVGAGTSGMLNLQNGNRYSFFTSVCAFFCCSMIFKVSIVFTLYVS